MKKVKWKWDMGCYIPLCPYCKEPAYENDHCVFCGKEYKWVDKSKERVVVVDDYAIVQASNNHIFVAKDGRVVLHASCTKRKSKRNLKKMVEEYEKVLVTLNDDLKEYDPKCKTITVPKFTYKGADDENS